MQLDTAKALLAGGDFSPETLSAAYPQLFPEDIDWHPVEAWPRLVNGQPVWPDDEVERALLDVLDAAMHRRLGHETQMSRSGNCIVFAPACRLHSRADRSGALAMAIDQLQHAGVEWQSLSQSELDAFLSWRDATRRRTSLEHAFILVTRPFNEAYFGYTGAASMFNNVILKNGLGQQLDQARVECVFVPAEGGRYAAAPNYPAIEKAIRRMREAFPDYQHAPVRDNNLPIPASVPA